MRFWKRRVGLKGLKNSLVGLGIGVGVQERTRDWKIVGGFLVVDMMDFGSVGDRCC